MLIGRKKELKLLNTICEEPKSQLVVIYGRRRIGKTYLVDYMFHQYRTDCLFFKFTGSASQDSSVQRDYFIEAIYQWFKEEPTTAITKWHQAFIFLKRVIDKEIEKRNHKGKVILFIDEVAWIDRHNKAGFLSAFGHFYNTYSELNKNLVVILCGSNASWIKNKIMKDTMGPLYQRVDIEIPLFPFDLKETKEYLLKEKQFDLDDKSIVDIYMIVGGVAKYLSYMDSKLSVVENIEKLFFMLNSPLYDEYDALFNSLFYDKSSQHKKIIDLLAQKTSGYTLSELETLIKKSKSYVIRVNLEELIDTGFIKPINRFNHKSKNSKYIIVDSFCLFYNKWIKPLSKNDIATTINHFETLFSSNSYLVWAGFAFETVMIANIHLYLQQRGLRSALKSIGYWNHTSTQKEDKGVQIDILIEYHHNIYDIVECKYYNNTFVITQEYAENLLRKKEKFVEFGLKGIKRYDIKIVMLTTYGTKVNRYYNQVNVAMDICLEDLM